MLPVFSTRNIFIYITGILIILLLSLLIVFFHSKRKGRDVWLRRHRVLSCFSLLCAVGHIVVYSLDFQVYQARINSIELPGIDTGSIGNGKYTGEYDAGYIYAKVQVTILNGEIQSIDLLKHRNEQGRAAEQVIPDILKTQEFPVDAIAGATNSSEVIQKAIQNALQ